MDKNFCHQIDQESLVEKYVAGNLRGDLLDKFEQHLKECENHAQAVLLEKALKRGVSEFARGEMKTRLRNRLKKREDTRFMMLRYAAILLVAVITPLILYYQLNVAPDEMAESVMQTEEALLGDDTEDSYEDEEQKQEASTTEMQAKESIPLVEEEKPVQPAAPAGASYKKPDESVTISDNETPVEPPQSQVTKSAKMQDMLKVAKTTSTPKIEEDYPIDEVPTAGKSSRGLSTYKTTAIAPPPSILKSEIEAKVTQDSLIIRNCIDNNLSESERQKYKLELKIEVKKTGTIGDITITRTTHQSTDLENCLLNLIKSWTFSEYNNDQQIIQIINYN